MEFDFNTIFVFLAGAYPVLKSVFAAIGLLIVVAKAFVKLTPSASDDAALEKLFALPIVGKLISALALHSPVKKAE